MKLSDREIELISNIQKNRRSRSLNLWFATAGIFIALIVGSYTSYDVTMTIAILGGFLVGQTAAYPSTRSTDKLIDLARRYVNSDPEAIRQLATNTRSTGDAV